MILKLIIFFTILVGTSLALSWACRMHGQPLLHHECLLDDYQFDMMDWQSTYSNIIMIQHYHSSMT